MWLAATPPANMWTATITEEAWKKMGSWSLSETPPHRSPHTREAPAEPHVLYDAAAGIGTPFWNSTPFDPVMWLQNVPREASARAARRGAGAKAATGATSAQARQPNHSSPSRCNHDLFKFIKEFVLARSALLKVLDVGGGDGQVGRIAKKAAPSIEWRSLDVSGAGERFDGRNLPAAANSTDLVLFNYVLHHAADDSIPLLKEARRVVKPNGRVIVVEDLRADDAAGLRHQDSEHKGCPRRCVFRTDNEWRAIFRRLGLRVESTAAPPRDCIPHYKVDRALYVIT